MELSGDSGKFGTLKFDFGDQVVEFGIYIKNRDQILDVAELAIANVDGLSSQILEIDRDFRLSQYWKQLP